MDVFAKMSLLMLTLADCKRHNLNEGVSTRMFGLFKNKSEMERALDGGVSPIAKYLAEADKLAQPFMSKEKELMSKGLAYQFAFAFEVFTRMAAHYRKNNQISKEDFEAAVDSTMKVFKRMHGQEMGIVIAKHGHQSVIKHEAAAEIGREQGLAYFGHLIELPNAGTLSPHAILRALK